MSARFYIKRQKRVCQQIENKNMNNINKTVALKNVMKLSCCVLLSFFGWGCSEIKSSFPKKVTSKYSLSLVFLLPFHHWTNIFVSQR